MARIKTLQRPGTITVDNCVDHVSRALGREQSPILRQFIRTILDYIASGIFGQQADGVYRPGHWFSEADTDVILEVATYVNSSRQLTPEMADRLKDVYRSGFTVPTTYSNYYC